MYQGYFHSWTDIDTVIMARETSRIGKKTLVSS